jgi:hypothetical protein
MCCSTCGASALGNEVAMLCTNCGAAEVAGLSAPVVIVVVAVTVVAALSSLSWMRRGSSNLKPRMA